MPNYNELYSNCVNSINTLIGEYKELIKSNDIAGLQRVKQLLVAEKSILREIAVDSAGFYQDTKDLLEKNKAEAYKRYRDEGMGTSDATNYSKLDSVPLYQAKNDFKCKRDKAYALLDGVTEILIEIAVINKNLREEEKYG